jgi:hypothetical protein
LSAVSSTGDFDVSDLFTGAPHATRKPRPARDIPRSSVPWGPLTHTGLAAAAAGGVWTGLRVSGVDAAPVLTWSVMGLAFASVLIVWSRNGPVWACACALLAGVFGLLAPWPPIAIAVGSVSVLAVRAVERHRAVSAK